MPKQFLLPDLGEGLTEAEVVTWLVAPGDIITIDQLVVEVESAKSIVELPSPYGGRVERLDAAQGQVVEKGGALLTIVALDEVVTGTESDPETPPQSVDVPGTAIRETEPASGPALSGSGAVLVGYGTKESSMRLKRPEGGRFGSRTPAAALRSSTTLLDPDRRSPVVSPLVRRRAKSHGFDASQLLGSGPGALVRRDDVEAAIASLSTDSPLTTTQPAMIPSGIPSADTDVRIPMTGMRKLIAARLSESRRVVPEATIWLDVDATELFAAKDRLQAATGERFSLTSLVARFCVAGLRQFPVLNSSVDEAANEIVQHGSINLGIAAQTPRGLMVPVVHGAHDLTTRELRDRVGELVAASEKGDFAPAVLSGGTFTLNNYGGFGVDGSTPIINYPEVAMLGVGRVIDRPWVVKGELAVRKVVTLSFVFDHRVCDGGVASGFLTYVARCVEEPLLLLGNL
jgi:2-oxoisovalerate dehydrogenase E2 component (dihydrolipoyl transacylase)